MADPVTIISPRGAQIIASNNVIEMPDTNLWEIVPRNTARIKMGTPGAPWPPDLEDKVEQWRSGKLVNLTKNGQIRYGVSAAIMGREGVRLWPIFGQNSPTHPTRPNELTPPAGLPDGPDILEKAMTELGQEIIITLDGHVGFWSFNGTILEPEWVVQYAKDHELKINHDLIVPVNLLHDMPEMVSIVAGDQKIHCWVAWEFDTGAMEIMIPMSAELPKNIILKDGERFDNGQWRGSNVVQMKLGEKAELIMRRFLDAKTKGFCR
ncbi:MAG: hypothetical protein WCP93_01415 [Candidatus Berkelbacteria bacterium]